MYTNIKDLNKLSKNKQKKNSKKNLKKIEKNYRENWERTKNKQRWATATDL